MDNSITVVLPARNESVGLEDLLSEIRKIVPQAELIVIDDGSEDDTAQIAGRHATLVISHPYPMGNGAAIKSGARAATGETIVFMDADGQHNPADIPRLLEKMDDGYKMVIGARNSQSQASTHRLVANSLFNRLASVMTGIKIEDLTSGFRAVNAKLFKGFLYLLPNGFSYPTTITMAFLRSGYPISYIPIEARVRAGDSKINPLRDGLRFVIIILRVGVMFSPMRLFLPISMALFMAGVGWYGLTYFSQGRFTNMGAVLFLASLLIFLIGIISEQISALHYKSMDNSESRERTDSESPN